jgi:hypothetical protein
MRGARHPPRRLAGGPPTSSTPSPPGVYSAGPLTAAISPLQSLAAGERRRVPPSDWVSYPSTPECMANPKQENLAPCRAHPVAVVICLTLPINLWCLQVALNQPGVVVLTRTFFASTAALGLYSTGKMWSSSQTAWRAYRAARPQVGGLCHAGRPEPSRSAFHTHRRGPGARSPLRWSVGLQRPQSDALQQTWRALDVACRSQRQRLEPGRASRCLRH